MGVTVTFQCMMQQLLLLSCDDVLKSDWSCQLSGCGINSLNSQKLPDCFSFGLETRLHTCSNTFQGFPSVGHILYTYRRSQICAYHLPLQEAPPMFEWTVCTKCETYRPPRSHHCRWTQTTASSILGSVLLSVCMWVMEVSDWGVGDTHDLCSYWMDTSWKHQLEQAKLFVDALISKSLW